jgi:FkbM family methyltransferase
MVDSLRLLASRLAKVVRGLGDPLLRRALARGVGAATEHDRILALQSWRTIVDVGANRGQFALGAHRLHPDAVIHAFEPQAAACAVFEAIFIGIDNVVLHACAIGSEDREAAMHVSAMDDSSSLLPISQAQSTIYPGTQAVAVEMVRVRPLQSELSAAEIQAPAMIKLDVQGYELEALRGAESLISLFDVVYVECSLVELYEGQALFTQVALWLAQHGFDLDDIGYTSRVKGRMIQADFLFRRR